MNNDELLFTCPSCDGFGETRSASLSPESDCDLATCPTCHGEGTVDHDPAEDSGDEEPGDIDSDECFNPYTGGYDDDC